MKPKGVTGSMHPEEIAFHVAPGAHAFLLLDQAGWHGSAELVVPPDITLVRLPPRCPALNALLSEVEVRIPKMARMYSDLMPRSVPI